MSDARKAPERSAPPPAAKPGATPSSPGLRTLSNPGTLRVMSAARTAPVEEVPKGPVSKRLASEASNAALNAVSILKELVQDFRERDRFFKFKAMILGGWLVLSALGIAVSCPKQGLETGGLGARVVDPKIKGRPTLMIYNESDEPWVDVIFIVNTDFRASVEAVKPGDFVTLTPKQLMSPSGAAPADMPMRNLELRTRDGKATLLRNGETVK
ncbi:hypothetical protein P2318_14720 [Myxococcaceae bacterium GXIMD 01537]